MRISEHTWNDVKNDITKLQPELTEIIEAIKPDDSYKFYRVRYYYGDTVIKNGTLCLPLKENRLVSLNDDRVAIKKYREQLSYSPIPAGLIESKSLEVYAEPNQRTAPLGVLRTGTFFGLWETLDPDLSIFVARAWNISAGARTIFFLPKVSEKISHKCLIETYGIKSHAKNTVFEQQQVFKELVEASGNKNWYCDILFFSKEWFTKQKSSNAWNAFRYFILDIAWQQTKGWRSKEYAELMWETLLSSLAKKRLKPSQNGLYAVRHLIDIAYGIYPGLKPTTDEMLAPIQLLQDIYINDYKLSQYAPILFSAFHGNIDIIGNEPVYYSLTHPTNINYTMSLGRVTSINLLREIVGLHNIIKKDVDSSELPVFETIKPVQYRYFHSQPDPGYGVLAASELPKFDPVIANIMEQHPDKKFPDYSSTLRGCITLTHIK